MRNFCAIILLLAAGCAHDPMRTAVAWRTHFTLQPVPETWTELEPAYTHEITLERDDQVFSFMGQLEFHDGSMTMAGLAPVGRLFVIQLGDSLSGEVSENLPRFTRPGFILADLQAMYWPVQSLERGGLSVSEIPGERQVQQNGKTIYRITYPNLQGGFDHPAVLQHLQRGYTLRVVPAGSSLQ